MKRDMQAYKEEGEGTIKHMYRLNSEKGSILDTLMFSLIYISTQTLSSKRERYNVISCVQAWRSARNQYRSGQEAQIQLKKGREESELYKVKEKSGRVKEALMVALQTPDDYLHELHTLVDNTLSLISGNKSRKGDDEE